MTFGDGKQLTPGPRLGDEVATEVYGRVVAVRANGDLVVSLSRYLGEVVRDPREVVVMKRALR